MFNSDGMQSARSLVQIIAKQIYNPQSNVFSSKWECGDHRIMCQRHWGCEPKQKCFTQRRYTQLRLGLWLHLPSAGFWSHRHPAGSALLHQFLEVHLDTPFTLGTGNWAQKYRNVNIWWSHCIICSHDSNNNLSLTQLILSTFTTTEKNNGNIFSSVVFYFIFSNQVNTEFYLELFLDCRPGPRHMSKWRVMFNLSLNLNKNKQIKFIMPSLQHVQAAAVGLWRALLQLLHWSLQQPAAVDEGGRPNQGGLSVRLPFSPLSLLVTLLTVTWISWTQMSW